MVDKCRNFGVKNVLISGFVYTTRLSLEVSEKYIKNLVLFVLVMVWYISIIETLEEVHFTNVDIN